MLSDLALMEMQTEALYRHDAAGRIVTTNEADPQSRAPRLFLGRTREGNLWRLRDDLPDDLVGGLGDLLGREPTLGDPRQAPVGFDALVAMLTAHGPVTYVWMGPAWRFPVSIRPETSAVLIESANVELARDHFPWLIRELPTCQPCTAVVENGKAVSLCFCARITARAAEAGVETAEPWRGRGFAVAAVAGWARAVRASGRAPLYSTSWENTASQRVASKLGLVLYGTDLNLT